MATPKLGQKSIFKQYMALGSMTSGVSSVINSLTMEYVYSSKLRHPFIAADSRAEMPCISESSYESCSVVNKLLLLKYFCDSKRRHRLYRQMGTPQRSEQNLIVRVGKSEAEVANNRRLCSIIVLFKANYKQT